MKKWVILLAITNAVTLMALSISLTVIVMRDYLKGYEKAEKSDSQKMADEGNKLTNNYESAKHQEKTEKNDDAKSANNSQNQEKPKKEMKKVIKYTAEDYENTDFQDRWIITIISYDMSSPDNSYAGLKSILNEEKYVTVGSVVETNKVVRITQEYVMFENPNGIYYEISEWAESDTSAGKSVDYRKYQDPDSGNITPKSTDLSKNIKKTTKSESFVTEDGNVIIVPEGVDKETLMKQLKSKQKAKAAEEAKALENITSEHHSLTPQTAYKIKQNLVEYVNEAVLENYYDVNKKKHDGIQIVNFDDDSMYKKFGFKKNDIVTHINDNRTYTTFDLDNIFKTVDFTKGAEIQILRNEKPLKLIFDFSMKDLLDLEQKMADTFKDKSEDSKESDKK